MRLINPSLEIYTQEPGLTGMYKQIEKCARVSYKSEDRITDDSYKKFLKMLYDKGHFSVFEQGTVYLDLPTPNLLTDDYEYILKYINNPYSVLYTDDDNKIFYVTSNLRVLLENGWLDDLKYICEPTEYHERRVCVKYTLSIGIGREFTRHRQFSFNQESTRYIDYSKNSKGGDVTYIIPTHIKLPEGYYTWWDNDWCISQVKDELPDKIAKHDENDAVDIYLHTLNRGATDYKILLNKGWTPQQARGVLPLDAKSELIMTGTISQWNEFFKLRVSKAAHPDAYYLAKSTQDEFRKLGYINE